MQKFTQEQRSLVQTTLRPFFILVVVGLFVGFLTALSVGGPMLTTNLFLAVIATLLHLGTTYLFAIFIMMWVATKPE